MFDSPLVPGPLRGLAQRVQDWSVASQQQARRNAMVATTACAQRRVERQDVDDYLDALDAPISLDSLDSMDPPAAPEESPGATTGRASRS